MAQLVRLSRLDLSPAARWTIVLAAEPLEAAHWNNALRESIDLRVDLPPWSMEDTVGYVQTALVDAGCLEPVFEDSALARLHELADGVPRRVTRLAEYALLAAATTGATSIDASTVDAVHEEIAWPASAAVYNG
jgi:type II secretory pathway predicted ATPase ExeA